MVYFSHNAFPSSIHHKSLIFRHFLMVFRIFPPFSRFSKALRNLPDITQDVALE